MVFGLFEPVHSEICLSIRLAAKIIPTVLFYEIVSGMSEFENKEKEEKVVDGDDEGDDAPHVSSCKYGQYVVDWSTLG